MLITEAEQVLDKLAREVDGTQSESCEIDATTCTRVYETEQGATYYFEDGSSIFELQQGEYILHDTEGESFVWIWEFYLI